MRRWSSCSVRGSDVFRRQVRTIPLVEPPSVLNFLSFGEHPQPSIGDTRTTGSTTGSPVIGWTPGITAPWLSRSREAV